MLASIGSATVLGVTGFPVTVEAHVSIGLPGFTIVGLPDESCREARDRVRAATLSSALKWPNKKITVNLAPSALRKVGTALDLAIAVAVLAAENDALRALCQSVIFIGELGLDGSVRSVPGIVPMVAALDDRPVVVPLSNVAEASLVASGPVRGVAHLAECVLALRGEARWPDPPPASRGASVTRPPDLTDVRGHRVARLALEVAAAGWHHLLMVGPPGSGKTMLASRLIGLLPALDHETALATTMIHSAAGLNIGGSLVTRPPFQSPHHTASRIALVGGGTATMRPGLIALAHGGVLFMDELAEFPTSVLESLRTPIESGLIRIDRAKASVEFPARFLLVGAMNPCPCGEGDRPGACRCNEGARLRYARKVSGPLLDRFDLRLTVRRANVDELMSTEMGESSAEVAERVSRARARAQARGVLANGHITGSRLDALAPLSPRAQSLLRTELADGRLTGRGLARVRRVARTIADLAGGGDVVDHESVAIALQLRADVTGLDRKIA